MEPMEERVTLGRTLNFATSVADYPASSGWALKIALVPRAGGSTITVTSTADGDDHRFQVSAATTGTWTAGTYDWESWVEKASELYAVSRGTTVLAAVGARTAAQTALDQARAAFAAWTPTTKSYVIGGRQMTFNAAADILVHIQYWEQQVAQEERAAGMAKGLKDRRQIYLRLGRA